MTRRFDLGQRLEGVYLPDHAAVSTNALRAEVHDPTWFLGRQWQLGEHLGNDAASPVSVTVTATETPITHPRPGADFDPRITPPEVIIESEPQQWWTPGRRVRIGSALTSALTAAGPTDPELLLADLAPPYDRLNGHALDGLRLFQSRAELNIDIGTFTALGVPAAEPDNNWDPAGLRYQAQFNSGGSTLDIPSHDGGDVDWYSVTADRHDDSGAQVTRTSHPSRVTYPGVPAPRWWHIDDHRTDPGAVAPHRTNLAALLMTHIASSHYDDWFTTPLTTTVGSILTVQSVEIRDSMGQVDEALPVTGWSMFRVSGLDNNSFLTWPTVLGPLSAAANLDQIAIGIDEDANLVWAVEQRIGGKEATDLVSPVHNSAPESTLASGPSVAKRPDFTYSPSDQVPPLWHPYLLADDGTRRFEPARMADLTVRPISIAPGPSSSLLRADGSTAPEPIDVSAIPRQGIHIERRYVLGRRTDGLPVLWVQRRATPLAAPPVSGLLFDVMETNYQES